MINFFRKIRKKLADDNKPLKYIRYAIGEIVLVVIGILIALQINNWNEDRQTDLIIKHKLESLIDNLKNDKVNLTLWKEQLRFKIHALQHLLELVGERPISLEVHIKEGMYVIPYIENSTYWKGPFPDSENKEFIGKTFLESGRSLYGGLNSMAFDELKSTGMFSLIKNDSLGIALHTYYEMFKAEFNQKYLRVEEKWRDEFKNQGAVFYNIETLDEPLKLITDEPKFEAALKEVINESLWIAHLVEQRLVAINDYLINDVENEIEKLN